MFDEGRVVTAERTAQCESGTWETTTQSAEPHVDKPFGYYVRKMLRRNGLKMTDIANASGMSLSYVSRVLGMNGAGPGVKLMDFFESRKMVTNEMRASYAQARGELDIRGLSQFQIAQLMGHVERMREETKTVKSE